MESGNERQIRWHPAVIQWCIALWNKPPSAYQAFRHSQFLILPHQNTLNSYVHYTDLSSGFDSNFIFRLVNEYKFYERPEHQRHDSEKEVHYSKYYMKNVRYSKKIKCRVRNSKK